MCSLGMPLCHSVMQQAMSSVRVSVAGHGRPGIVRGLSLKSGQSWQPLLPARQAYARHCISLCAVATAQLDADMCSANTSQVHSELRMLQNGHAPMATGGFGVRRDCKPAVTASGMADPNHAVPRAYVWAANRGAGGSYMDPGRLSRVKDR